MNAPERRRSEAREALACQAIRERRQQPQIHNLRAEHQQAVGKCVESEPAVEKVEEEAFAQRAKCSLRARLEKRFPELFVRECRQQQE